MRGRLLRPRTARPRFRSAALRRMVGPRPGEPVSHGATLPPHARSRGMAVEQSVDYVDGTVASIAGDIRGRGYATAPREKRVFDRLFGVSARSAWAAAGRRAHAARA